MKKISTLFLALVLSAFVLAACGETPIADQVIKDVVDPPAPPTLGDPIPLAIGQPVEIAMGETTLTLEYQGQNSAGFYQWTCRDGQGESCAERHSNESDMLFYYDFKLVGVTINDSFALVSGWEVKLYP